MLCSVRSHFPLTPYQVTAVLGPFVYADLRCIFRLRKILTDSSPVFKVTSRPNKMYIKRDDSKKFF